MMRITSALLLLGAALGLPYGATDGDGFDREGSGAARAEKDALEGKAPPPLEVGGWMNADAPLVLSELRGKVVLLKFWGVW